MIVGEPLQPLSKQHASLGSALTLDGTPEGYFDGVLDEARVWNYARSKDSVRATINSELTGPRTGLVAVWNLNETGADTIAHDASGNGINGVVKNSNWNWTSGAPFNLVFSGEPNSPTLISPADQANNVSTSPTLCVNVTDSSSNNLTVTFCGRPVPHTPKKKITVMGLGLLGARVEKTPRS